MQTNLILIAATVLVVAMMWALGVFDYFEAFRVPANLRCQTDSDCVPAGCCHPNSCTSSAYRSDCTGMACTMSCEGPLDCGAGSCGCVSNRCTVAPAK